MTGRSLRCSPEGIKIAKNKLRQYSLTQKALAEELGVSRQPVVKFFTGKPVDRNLFREICEKLQLEWNKIVLKPAVELELGEENQTNSIDIDVLVREVQETIQAKIQKQYEAIQARIQKQYELADSDTPQEEHRRRLIEQEQYN